MACELCNRDVELTDHHLIPRAVHSKGKFIRRYGKEEMRTRILRLCKLCHKGVHDLYSEKELAENYNTKELLLESEKIRKHVKWVKKQK